MAKTTLTNNSDSPVQVKEGNSNIFRNLQVLHKGESMTIQADPSATYREYALIVMPSNAKLRPLSSDDIHEYGAVEIFQDKDGKIDWIGKKKSWFSLFTGLFRKK